MLPDLLDDDLLVIFVGTAKSRTSAVAGHYYAHRSNYFWSLLEATGLTGGEYLGPSRDSEVLDHRVGLTDLVPGRAASSDALLKPGDYQVSSFLTKTQCYSPQVIAFGEKAATKVARHLGEPKPGEGPVPWLVAGARAYRLPSSPGAHATTSVADKHRAWKQFGDWVRGIT